MDGDRIYDLLQKIKGLSSTALKIETLSQYADDKGLRNTLVAGMDPSIRFGFKPAWKDFNFSGEGNPMNMDNLGMSFWINSKATPMDKKRRLRKDRKKMSEKSARLLTSILLKKLDFGMGKTYVNQAIPGLISTFDVMLAKPVVERHLQFPMTVEPKYDGMRLIASFDDTLGRYKFYTRAGHDVGVLDLLQAPLEKLIELLGQHYAFDGEIVTGSFSETMSDVRKMDKQVAKATFRIFDILPPDFLGIGTLEWMDQTHRRKLLESAFRPNGVYMDITAGSGATLMIPPVYKVNSEAEIYNYYNAFLRDGHEGAMIKKPDAPYVRKRSFFWMKVKPKETDDLRVIGGFEGTGKFENSLGGLIVDRKGVQVRVGGGFTDADRELLWAQFCEDESEGEDHAGRIIGRLIEVSYQEVTPDGSLRHPVFHRVRNDKVEASF